MRWTLIFLIPALLLLPACAAKATPVSASTATEAAASAFHAGANPEPTPERPPALMPVPTPEPTPEPPAADPPPLTAKLSVVGDIMLHQWQIDDAYDKATGAYDFNGEFAAIAPYLADSYVIGNLETVFGGGAFSDFPCFNALDEFGTAISGAGFDLLTTANNHTNDQRTRGILRTLEVLDALGIGHIGTYASQEARDDILIQDINGITFAFLSYTYGTNGIPVEKDKPYLVNIMNEQLIQDDIRRARALEPDFVVVLPHMGNEYESAPRAVFKNWIRLMLDAGADIVLASHPHVLQPIETLDLGDREGLCIYSLGNFISSQRTQPRDAGVILDLYFEKEHGKPARMTKAECIPTWVQFINSAGVYDIKVLPVADTLRNVEAGTYSLRPKDIERLKAVWRDANSMYGAYVRPADSPTDSATNDEREE